MTDPVPTEVKVAEVAVQGFWAKQVAWIKANPTKVAFGVLALAVVLAWKIL